MAKIKINSYLNNKTKNEENFCDTNGIIIKNKIIFYDLEIKVTIDINEDSVVVNRFTDNSNYVHLVFDKKNPVCKVYTGGKSLELDIKINDIKIQEKLIEVNYEIENCDQILFKLNYGE